MMRKDQPYIVRMGIKGARRIIERSFDTREEAEARAERWRASNSIGSYTAKVEKR